MIEGLTKNKEIKQEPGFGSCFNYNKVIRKLPS